MCVHLHHGRAAETSIYLHGGGPTGCGKAQFIFRLIRHANQVIDPPP
jgi:hypothetical protein